MTVASNRFASVLTGLGWPSRNPNDPIELIGFTGCTSGHGVSTIAAQVAATTATEFDNRTLLVDCNFSNPSLHRIFDCAQSPGLADMSSTYEEFGRLIQETSVKNLHLLPAGHGNPQPTWNEELIRTIFRTVLADYELVICDIPAIGSQPHAISTLAIMDRVLLVVDSQRISSRQLEDHRKLMARRGIAISGVVMNRTRQVLRNRGT